jgi:hypothetical protein
MADQSRHPRMSQIDCVKNSDARMLTAEELGYMLFRLTEFMIRRHHAKTHG